MGFEIKMADECVFMDGTINETDYLRVPLGIECESYLLEITKGKLQIN